MKHIWLVVYTCCLVLLVLLPKITPGSIQSDSNTSRVLGVRDSILLRGAESPETIQSFTDYSGVFDVSKIHAKSFLVFYKNTNQVVLSHNDQQTLAIGSLTKLMTVLIALENYDPLSEITMESSYIETTKPVVGFTAGERFKVQDLILASLVGSANDAALSLAQSISNKTGANFVDLMNNKAKQIGMLNTRFSNPLGFDDENNYSSSQDLALLVQACLKHGVFELIGKTPFFSFQNTEGKMYQVKATNRLVSKHSDIFAIKTGNTPQSLGSMITQTNSPSGIFIIIVLGSDTREGDTLLLADFLRQNPLKSSKNSENLVQ